MGQPADDPLGQGTGFEADPLQVLTLWCQAGGDLARAGDHDGLSGDGTISGHHVDGGLLQRDVQGGVEGVGHCNHLRREGCQADHHDPLTQ
jgi:hypothetical protein